MKQQTFGPVLAQRPAATPASDGRNRAGRHGPASCPAETADTSTAGVEQAAERGTGGRGDPPAGQTKPGWGACPPAELPLRKVQPQFRAETAARLVKFGDSQPETVHVWLSLRGLDYWAAGFENVDALTCLDLLAWQAGGMADKAALERLPADVEMFWKKKGRR